MVGEGRGRLAAEQPSEADLVRRRIQQVTPAHDQVDPLAQVVHHHREAVAPAAVAVADDGVAAAATTPSHGPARRSSQASDPPPSATRTVASTASRSRHPPGQPGPVQAAPCVSAQPRKVVRVQSQP